MQASIAPRPTSPTPSSTSNGNQAEREASAAFTQNRNAREVRACRPWLEHEIGAIKPRIIVALGSTAAQSLFGPAFRVTRDRGKPIEGTTWAETVVATVHPSSILRAPDHTAREEAYAAFVKDLKVVANLLSEPGR